MLAPKEGGINRDSLSRYFSDITIRYEIKVGGIDKIFLNLGTKGRYILHNRNIQLYLSLGMKLIENCRILKLKQSDLFKKLH